MAIAVVDVAVLLVGAAVAALSTPAMQHSMQEGANALAKGLSQMADGIKEKFSNAEPKAREACPDNEPPEEPNEEKPDASEAPKAEDLEGKSPKEIDQMMKDRGWPSEPTRDGPGSGTRYPNPDRPGDQVRVMPGKATDPNPIKQGPYARISEGGKVSDPIPLRGNPTLP
jgi:X-X-X-Leu-X-X-Gly heptad repeat protein